jgi:hypothetical protein
MDKLILVSKNQKIIVEIMDYISRLPRVIEERKLKKPAEFYVESPDDSTLYYYLRCDCEEGLVEYAKGFCCGYMAGKGFDNSK